MLQLIRTASGGCRYVEFRDLGLHAQSPGIQDWPMSGPGQVGYDDECQCYCWGYRPTPVEIIGLGQLGAGEPIQPRFCMPGSSAAARSCNQDCPVSTDCPTCPPPPLVAAQQQAGLSEWGTNLGWLLAGAVVAGGGF